MDKTRVFEAAGKFASKGQLDKAAKEYQRVLDEDPKEVRALQKLAEVYQKLGKVKEASDLMLRVAEGYSEQGFFLKAVAVYKQVLKVGTERIDVNLKLAQLYQQLGLVGDATQQYQLVANHYDKSGNVKESLAALRKMVDLDPDNVASRVKLGELYARERMDSEAVTELKRAASYLKKNSRADDHLRVLERIGQLVPDDVPVAKELAQAFLARQDTKRALAKLQVCFRQNPKDAETLTLLARAFQELGQDQKTLSVYRELAHVYGEQGNADLRRQTLEKIVARAPDDAEATQALRELDRGRPPGPPPAVIAPPPPSAPQPTAAPSPPAVITPPPPRAGPPPPLPAPPAARPSAMLAAPGTSAAVAKILTETDVYLKYGLVAKAAEHIQRALREDSSSVAAHEKLLQILDRQQRADEATQTIAKLVELSRHHGDEERNRIYTQELGQRAPGHPLVAAAAAAADLGGADELVIEADEVDLAAAHAAADAAQDDVVTGDEVFEEIRTEDTIPPPNSQRFVPPGNPFGAPPPSPFAPPPGPAPWDAPLAGEDDDDDVVVDAEALGPEDGLAPPTGLDLDANELDATFGRETGPQARAGYTPTPAPAAGIDPFALDRDDDPDDAVVMLDVPATEEDLPPYDEAPAPPPFEPEQAGALDDAPAAFEDELPAPLEAAEDFGPAPADFDETPFGVAPTTDFEPAPAPVADDEDLFGEEVAEADFLIQQELLDDAKYALEAILAQAPAHPRASDLYRRFQEREQTSPPPPPMPAASEPAPMDGGFDLGAELADQLDGAFDAVLSNAEQRGATPPPDGQYSVGDVLSEFKAKLSQTVSVEDSQTHYDLGIAYKEMGLFEDAVHEFQVAMGGTGQRRVVDCLTMLGVCHLEHGQPKEAIEFFAKALKTPGLTIEASKEAHYEIGHCREKLGELRAAFDHYARVYKADPKFRDVAACVARLKPKVGPITLPPPVRPAAPAPAPGAKTVPAARPGTPAIGRASMPPPVAPKAPEPAAAEPQPPKSGRKIGFV